MSTPIGGIGIKISTPFVTAFLYEGGFNMKFDLKDVK